MSFPVRYYCPRCETIVTIQRAGYLADKSVTPFPLEGWTYTDVDGEYDEADGVRFVCGQGETETDGCGEPFYLNFVRFENGRAVEPSGETERVSLASDGPVRPRRPDSPGTPR